MALNNQLLDLRCHMYDLGLLPARPRGVTAPTRTFVKASRAAPIHEARSSIINLDLTLDTKCISLLQQEYPEERWQVTREPVDKVAPMTSLKHIGAANVSNA